MTQEEEVLREILTRGYGLEVHIGPNSFHSEKGKFCFTYRIISGDNKYGRGVVLEDVDFGRLSECISGCFRYLSNSIRETLKYMDAKGVK